MSIHSIQTPNLHHVWKYFTECTVNNTILEDNCYWYGFSLITTESNITQHYIQHQNTKGRIYSWLRNHKKKSHLLPSHLFYGVSDESILKKTDLGTMGLHHIDRFTRPLWQVHQDHSFEVWCCPWLFHHSYYHNEQEPQIERSAAR